jgi:capsular polysaccharide biosynthesis protein
VKHGDSTAAPPQAHIGELSRQLWDFGDFGADEDNSASELATGLISLGFIREALRRTRKFWCATAVIGLLIGGYALHKFPPSYQASATIQLGNNNFVPPGIAVQDDQGIAQSHAVAESALRSLGLARVVSPVVYVGDYSALILTNNLLSITVKAGNPTDAVRQANALANAFLAVQKRTLLVQEATIDAALRQSITAAEDHLSALNKQISQLPAGSGATPQRVRLVTERNEAAGELQPLKNSLRGTIGNTRAWTATLINGSFVLDRGALLPRHMKRYLLLYVGGGLIGGLFLGLFIVIFRELVSDRLRRREDVARAIGAPVRLSVSKLDLKKWRPGPQALAKAPGPRIQQIVAHLERAVPDDPRGLAALAVVPVDEPQVSALSLATLALSCARQGRRVIVADLCPGYPVAKWLGVGGPGMHEATVAEARLLVAIPDPDDVAPPGPLSRTAQQQRSAADGPAFSDEVSAVCASADVLLTLAALDPATGGEHLSGWAHRVIAVVTAGRASAARIHAAGEMIRLAGIELLSAVLIGADTTDESLGEITAATPAAPARSGVS